MPYMHPCFCSPPSFMYSSPARVFLLPRLTTTYASALRYLSSPSHSRSVFLPVLFYLSFYDSRPVCLFILFVPALHASLARGH
ncbi:hypothetical protein BV22DRAFT_827007 [Leucogyrophana mollusca]|uniref:Uncharacterized protein n=1 Tax=Leucogyrophana mollusca TaxID=85980 RepID=A0ACB8B331_9AGAM|nr:hypothetical protein BV22DRAFT_827007 [Leucogyrophana mollusca]